MSKPRVSDDRLLRHMETLTNLMADYHPDGIPEQLHLRQKIASDLLDARRELAASQ